MTKGILLTALLLVASAFAHAAPQQTLFTYQGSLSANGAPANGTYDFTFTLYNAETDGSPLTSPVAIPGLTVSNGSFTVDLDFPGQFAGEQRWIEVAVDGQTLSPRQPVGAVPVAQFALNADVAGPPGPPGPQGPAGPTGPVGAEGPQGPMGATGAEGPAGATGAAGPIGPAGPQGQAGATGAIGPAGPAGATGPAGPQGLTGATGSAGADGAQGPAGPAGPQGLTGATGAIGPAGPQGLVGATGAAGSEGPQGLPGATGSAGPQGLTGATGPTGPEGPPGVVGPAGPQGATGATGPAGAEGPQGPSGPAGSANINGTVNRLVKFTSATSGGNSLVFDNGTTVGVGTTTPSGSAKLDVNGVLAVQGVGVITQGGNDVWANIRTLRNTSSTLNDGMYIGYAGSGGPIRFFSNQGTTEYMRIETNGAVGVGTPGPWARFTVVGKSAFTRDGVAECCGNDATITLAENTSATGLRAGVSFQDAGVSEGTFELANGDQASGSIRRFRMYENQGQNMGLETTGIGLFNGHATGYTAYVEGPGTGADNQDHNIFCPDGHAMVNFAAYASDALDGQMNMNCEYLGNALNDGDRYTAFDNGCDANCVHLAACAAGYLATGVQILSDTRLDRNVRLRCTRVRATTTGPTRASMSFPFSPMQNTMHVTMCQPGTFVQQLSISATTHLVGSMYAYCAGLRP